MKPVNKMDNIKKPSVSAATNALCHIVRHTNQTKISIVERHGTAGNPNGRLFYHARGGRTIPVYYTYIYVIYGSGSGEEARLLTFRVEERVRQIEGSEHRSDVAPAVGDLAARGLLTAGFEIVVGPPRTVRV